MVLDLLKSFFFGGKRSKKRFAFFLLFMNVVTSAAVSIYIPCLKMMAIDLSTTGAMLQMSIVTYLIGEFFGRLIAGPLIDAYNIKKILIPAITISIIGHFGCCISSSIYLFLIMRFVQAAGASAIYIASIGIINSDFNEKERSEVIGILELYQPIAWILSPFIGSILAEMSSWRFSFFTLMIAQVFGLLIFSIYSEKYHEKLREKISLSICFCNYSAVLKNSYFLMYALIPGLFAGGYMIFMTNSPFICSRVFGNNSVDTALFQAIPLIFYVLATFAYRTIVNTFNIKLAKKIGICVYIIFAIYITLIILDKTYTWTANHLLALMCIQCVGSAFLVPISIIKAIQSTGDISCVGASTVVVFRNIIMALCISISTKLSENITMIMGCVFMTVGTVLILITARKIIKVRHMKKLKN